MRGQPNVELTASNLIGIVDTLVMSFACKSCFPWPKATRQENRWTETSRSPIRKMNTESAKAPRKPRESLAKANTPQIKGQAHGNLPSTPCLMSARHGLNFRSNIDLRSFLLCVQPYFRIVMHHLTSINSCRTCLAAWRGKIPNSLAASRP